MEVDAHPLFRKFIMRPSWQSTECENQDLTVPSSSLSVLLPPYNLPRGLANNSGRVQHLLESVFKILKVAFRSGEHKK